MLADLAGLADEPKGGEPAQQGFVDAGALADEHQRLHPCQLGGKALWVRFASGENGDVVARQAGKAGQMTHLILIVIQYGNPHKHSVSQGGLAAYPTGNGVSCVVK